MSERSIVRAHRRAEQRRRGRAKRVAAAGAAAVGTAFAFAPAAEATNFQVTNLDDDGAGSLRAAVAFANLAPDADTITFAPGLEGEIRLTSGEIEIDAALDIQGPGPGTLSINGTGNSRIFYLDAGDVGESRDVVSISGLRLRNGSESDGGAIYVDETDTRLSNLLINNNYSSGTGGAIDLESSPISITDSVLRNNRSDSGGGALYTDGDATDQPQDTVTVRNSKITENYADGDGGAFYFDNATGGDVLIVGSDVSDNTATGSGGGFEFYGHRGGSTIRDSTLSGNTADGVGGGLYFDVDYADPDGLLVENTTISGNFSDSGGGGAYIENSDAETGGKPVSFVDSTIVRNTSTSAGGGIYRNDYDVLLSSTIVADNDQAGGTEDDLAEDPAATEQFTAGFSLVEGGFSTVTVVETPAGSNKTGVDPQLGPLALNGGSTPTHLPPLTSPVIDAGIANGLTTDQRGLARTVDQPSVPNAAGSDGTDIGSVEVALEDTKVDKPKLKAKKTQKQKGNKIKIKVKVGAAEAVEVVASGKVKAGKKSYGLKKKTTSTGAGETKTLTLKPKGKKASKKIVKFLATGKKAKANLSAAFTDALGNEATKKAKVTLKAAKPKK